MANSSDRSKVILIDANAKTEEFKRPDHPDFMTSSELKKIEFTGVRENQLAQAYEFWITGKIVSSVTFADAKRDTSLLGRTHAEVFKM